MAKKRTTKKASAKAVKKKVARKKPAAKTSAKPEKPKPAAKRKPTRTSTRSSTRSSTRHSPAKTKPKRKPARKPPGKKKQTADGLAYDKVKAAAAARSARLVAAGSEIGELPAVAHPIIKKRARRDFRYFCEKYFPLRFSIAWSPDHLKVIAAIEETVLRGGLFAMAMPRGSGKTTLTEGAILWAALYGHHKYIAAIGATAAHAAEILESIKIEVETNELLAADFPAVCYPIHKLDRKSNRTRGQKYQGKATYISWKADVAILPTIKGSPASGCRIQVVGLLGRIRGMKHTHPGGATDRPSLAIIDDPQTDDSANSVAQSAKRERVLAGAILGLAGPGKRISAIMPCTVIRADDMADAILDRERHPEWNGVRTKLVYKWPTNAKLWSQYGELRREGMREGDDGQAATEFYRKRQAAMDKGAVVAWEQRYNSDELSAIQHAVNLRLRNEAAFFAEYQNEPIDETDDAEFLDTPEVAKKFNNLARGVVPITCHRLTAFVDVHANILYYAVVAWEENYTGHVVDYGTWPEQSVAYFTQRQAKATLRRKYRKHGKEGAIFAGLTDLVDAIASKPYRRSDGADVAVVLTLVDAAWSPDVVFRFARQYRGAAVLPARGLFVGASSQPWDERRGQKGERPGDHWRIRPVEGHAVQMAQVDTNHWKSFFQTRLATPTGDPGALSFFGDSAKTHRLVADHATAEFRVTTEGRGRVVDQWKARPGRDNHYLDALVGATAAASMAGIQLAAPTKATGDRKPAKKKKTRKRTRGHTKPL